MPVPGRNTYAWRRIVRNLKETATHCARCGEPLDRTLKFPHPMSTTGGHIMAIEDAPELADDPMNAQAEHLSCNSADGARRTNAKRSGNERLAPEVISSPGWT